MEDKLDYIVYKDDDGYWRIANGTPSASDKKFETYAEIEEYINS